jgi:hypothetical protein
MIRVAPAGPADVLYPSKVFYRVEDTGGGFPIRG